MSVTDKPNDHKNIEAYIDKAIHDKIISMFFKDDNPPKKNKLYTDNPDTSDDETSPDENEESTDNDNDNDTDSDTDYLQEFNNYIYIPFNIKLTVATDAPTKKQHDATIRKFNKEYGTRETGATGTPHNYFTNSNIIYDLKKYPELYDHYLNKIYTVIPMHLNITAHLNIKPVQNPAIEYKTIPEMAANNIINCFNCVIKNAHYFHCYDSRIFDIITDPKNAKKNNMLYEHLIYNRLTNEPNKCTIVTHRNNTDYIFKVISRHDNDIIKVQRIRPQIICILTSIRNCKDYHYSKYNLLNAYGAILTLNVKQCLYYDTQDYIIHYKQYEKF